MDLYTEYMELDKRVKLVQLTHKLKKCASINGIDDIGNFDKTIDEIKNICFSEGRLSAKKSILNSIERGNY